MPLHNKIGQGPTRTFVKLRILETTDLHANLLPYDYFADRPAPAIGLALAASLVRSLRADADNCLLFDNGDFLQGNPMADWIASDTGFGPGDLHPVIGAMNSLGYDAGTLGNHEFDYGLDFLTDAIAEARFPLVSANALRRLGNSPADEQTLVPPYVLLDRHLIGSDGQSHPVRIGVIGFAPPQLVAWNRMILQDRIVARDIVAAARYHVPLMRQAGADLVVALCHSGIVADDPTDGMENASLSLASVDGVDIILTGHTHLLFPQPDLAGTATINQVNGALHGKPAVMAGFYGSHVGVIDLLLGRQDGRWEIVSHHSRVEPVTELDANGNQVARLPADPLIQAAAAVAHAQILNVIRKPIGATLVPLHSYFALVAPDVTIQLVADAQSAHAAQVLHGTHWAHLPILSAVAPSKAGGNGGDQNYIDIPPGPLEIRHSAELSVFPNTFCILALDGADLLDWLELSAGLFAPIVPGQTEQPLLNPDFPSYNFDVIDGITYQIDPSQSSRTDSQGRVINPNSCRVSGLCWNGIPVQPEQTLLIATNSYRFGGGGGFNMANRAKIIHHSAESTRDIVTRHLRQSSPLTCAPRTIWKFAPMPGTGAWFDSAAKGLPYLPAVNGLTIRSIGAQARGMWRFGLSF